MYRPRHFDVDDPVAVLAMVRDVGFGHLVVTGDDGLASTPMPFVIDDDLRSLRAHLARPNPVWRYAPCDALVVVPGRDAYVSPTWYPSKALDGRVVPTWNYEVVHLHGRLVAHDDAGWVERQIRELTERNEATMSHSWSVDDPPTDYVEQLQRAIVGIEIEVVRVGAKRKASQNRSVADRAAVHDALGW